MICQAKFFTEKKLGLLSKMEKGCTLGQDSNLPQGIERKIVEVHGSTIDPTAMDYFHG